MEAMRLVSQLAEVGRQAKFPTSAAGRLFNVLKIFQHLPDCLLHRGQGNTHRHNIQTQCSFSTITIQCYSVLSSLPYAYDRYSVCTMYTWCKLNICTPPGFCRVTRGQPVCACGPRYPYQKQRSLRIKSTIFGGRGQFIFYFLL